MSNAAQAGQGQGEAPAGGARLAEGAPAPAAPTFALGGSLGDHLEDDAPPPAPPPVEPEVEVTEGEDGAVEAPAAKYAQLPEATDEPLPAWVKIPKGFKFPRGRRAVFVFFHARLTDAPAFGDRQAILWSHTPEDEKFAFNRAQGDANRAPHELAKQMIRAVDGFTADWSGTPSQGNVDTFWRQIGGKYRDLLVRLYAQLHVLTREETDDFFVNCIAVRSSG